MPNAWKRPVLIAVLATYCAGLGVLSGILVERLRFDAQRRQVLAHYDRAARELRERLMAIELTATRWVATTSRTEIELDSRGAGGLDERHASR
jgi:hypothetical protein